jgi:dihydropyrimidinase
MVFLQSLVGVRTTEEVEVAVTPMLSSQAQMPAYDLIVYNGRVVTTSSVSRTDVWIGVIGGKIATVSSSPCPLEAAARSIDADGAYITPGGVDTHVHLSQLQHPAGTDTGDTFESGTRSAIAGGTTTIVAFANQQKHDESLYPIVEEYHRRSAGQCYTDYGFHLILTNPTPKVLDEEIPELFEEQGISSIKVYMTYENRKVTDRDMLEIMIRARKLGITLMIHAENDDMVNLCVLDRSVQRARGSLTDLANLGYAPAASSTTSKNGLSLLQRIMPSLAILSLKQKRRTAPYPSGRSWLLPSSSFMCPRQSPCPPSGRPRQKDNPCSRRRVRSTSFSSPRT